MKIEHIITIFLLFLIIILLVIDITLRFGNLNLAQSQYTIYASNLKINNGNVKKTKKTDKFYHSQDVIVKNNEPIPLQYYRGKSFIRDENLYVYTGQSRLCLFRVSLKYKNINKDLPYGIVKFHIKVNGEIVASKKYGYNSLNNIEDSFTLDLDTDDVIGFYIESLECDKYILKKHSVITCSDIKF